MSLINDALKKAQKQRTGESPSLASMPSVGGETPQRIAKRAKPAGFDTLIIRAGVGAGVVLVLAIGGWFVLSPKAESGKLKAEDSNPQTAATSAASSNVGSRPAVPSAVAGVADPGLPAIGQATAGPASPRPATSAPAFTLPVAPKPGPVAQVTVAGVADPGLPAIGQATAGPASPRPATNVQPTGSSLQVSPFRPQGSTPAASPQTAASNPQLSAFSSQPSVSAAPPAKLEPRAIQFIENIKVGAIMARTTADAKVLMNDRVYRVGSIVEAELGLTLVEITTGSLTFEDERGGRYTRTF